MAFEKTLKNRIADKLSDETGAKIKISPLAIVKSFALALLAGLLGSSGAAFSCYPFGIALLAAADRYVPAVYIGLIISSLFNRGMAVALAIVYTVTLLLRIALGRVASDIAVSNTDNSTKSGSVRGRSHTKKAAGTPPAHGQNTDNTRHFSAANDDAHKIGGKSKLITRLRGQAAALASGDAGATMFGESILLRIASSCFAAFVFGLYRLISGGFLYYDLFGFVLGFFLCPLLTLAMSMVFNRDERLLRYAEIGTAVIMFVTVFALRDYNIFGFSPAFTAAVIVALWAGSSGSSSRECALRGCTAGLIAGLASGTNFGIYTITSAPCIAAATGLLAGMFWKLSRAFSAAAVCIVSMALGASLDGFTVLQTILPDTLGAVTIFMPLAYYGLLPRLPAFAQQTNDKTGDLALITEKKQHDTILRMNSLSEALGRLSDVIYTLSDRLRRPGIIDLKQICDTSFDKHCSRCSLASLCFERECTSTLDAQSKITTELYTKGRIETDSVPSYLRERCYNIENIISDINLETAALVERLIRSDKTEAFALDYESMSRLLNESIAENEAEYKIDTELTSKLRRSLKYMDMSGARAICWGNRRKQVVLSNVELAGMRLGADEIRTAAENTLHTRLTRPKFNIEGDSVEVTMSARRRYNVEKARAASIKETESANGDTALTFETREDYFYTLISDGMGSGREAAITSKLCAIFVEQLLSGGNSKAVTLEMLNGFIRSRGCECSATVDLAEIDLISGHACFIKSGAAPSFILRNGNLYKLQSKTVPIGIMAALDAEQIKFDLEEGDIIIMLSDGIAQSLEDGVWLANLLTYEWEDNLQIMAEKIIDNAALNNKRSDDMTAVLVRVVDYVENE
ncbi:MAG: SpoIIE family protein phosphatase [Clostridiales bacterium]|nr:SpoIIE family protein phosphatase [Clostridiales bacterium]